MNAARQQFERGFMLWLDFDGGIIFAVADDGWWRRYADVWGGQTENIDDAPPGLLTPQRGFGNVCGSGSEAKGHLGWATADEVPGEGHCHDAGDGDWAISFGDWAEMLEVSPRPPVEPPAPIPDPPGPTPPFELPPLHEQSNYHMLMLPSAEKPLVFWNTHWFMWAHPQSNGNIVAQLAIKPVLRFDPNIECPDELQVVERDGQHFVWFSGEYARGLWAHLLRVAYKPFVECVDRWPPSA